MTEESRIINIDFDNKNHRNVIMKLCEINNGYHYYDTFVVINLNRFKKNEVTEEELIEVMIKSRGDDSSVKMMKMKNRNIVESTSKFLKERFEGMTWSGEIILEGKKAVGFIINSWSEEKEDLFIEFLLIDRKYRKKGYGTRLIQNIQKKSKEMKCCLGIQPDDINMRIWYKNKFNFKEYDELKDILFVASKKERESNIYYFDEEVYKFKKEELDGDNEESKSKRDFFKLTQEIEENLSDKSEIFYKMAYQLSKMKE